MYDEEDIFEYRLIPLTTDITNIFRFDRDNDLVPTNAPEALHTSSNPDPISPTTSDDDHSAPDPELLLSTTSQADATASVSDALPPTTPSVVDHITSHSDPSPPATFEVDGPALESSPPETQLSGQGDHSISHEDSPASNTDHLHVDSGTEADIVHLSNETDIPATQDRTSKMNRPAAKSNWPCHCYPFNTLPVLRSHALPHFVLINAGEKLAKIESQYVAPDVAQIFKIDILQAMQSLMTMQDIYKSWIQAVVPSKFYATPQRPPSEDDTTESEGEKEQAEISTTMSETLGAGATDMTDHPGPRPEIESDRSKRYSRRQNENEGLASHSPAGAVTDTEAPTHASVANPEVSGEPSEPSRESTATSLPPFAAPAAPAQTTAPAETIRLSVPDPIKAIEITLQDQVAAARKAVAVGKVTINTSSQASRSVATNIPTGIPKTLSRAGGSGQAGSSRGKYDASGRLATVADESTQNKMAMPKDRAWMTETFHPAPGGSEHKDSRRASISIDKDMVSTDSDVPTAGEAIAEGNFRTTATHTQAPGESHVKVSQQEHLGNSQISSRANLLNAQSGATLDIPVSVEGHSQHQEIAQPLPTFASGCSYAIQHTQITKDDGHGKSGGEGGLEQPPEQKRRRVARPSEGEAVLPISRIPRPVGNARFIEMKKKKTPMLPPLRVSFVQDQREDPPVASGSRTRNERMSTKPDRTQGKDESEGGLKPEGSKQRSKQLDDDEQDGKGRKSAKSGKKRRYSRRSLGSG